MVDLETYQQHMNEGVKQLRIALAGCVLPKPPGIPDTELGRVILDEIHSIEAHAGLAPTEIDPAVLERIYIG